MRVVDAAPLRIALAVSVILHTGVLYWGVWRDGSAPVVHEARSFEITLAQRRASRDESGMPAAASDPTRASEPAPVEADARAESPGARRSEAAAPAPAAAPSGPRTRLDLSLPAEAIAPATESRPDAGVFDPALRARIGEARAARRSAPSTAEVRSWSSGAGRTRIESDRGCFERVDDPFPDQPGQQWSFVKCSPGEVIDWGRRFRARP
ncbi:MAG: hypothetical protein V2J24_19135 [Pseudomonadales bacterium]|nr:hypothetical protein [Pseudomonadales bacterium]